MTRRTNKILISAVAAGGILLILVLITIGVLQEGANRKDPFRITFVSKTIDESNDFWTALLEGAQMGAEEMGAEIKVVGGTAEDDYETQNQLIKKSIEEGPDALLIAPCSYDKTTPLIQEAVNRGITVILIDSVVDQDVANGIVATDNHHAGRELGSYTKELLRPNSKIGIVAHVKNSSTALERENGIREGLGGDAEKIKEVVYCNSSYQLAESITKEMLIKHPDMDIIIGTNEYAAVGAAQAVKSMNKENQVKIVGFDNSVEEIQLLEAGLFKGMVIQKPFNMGYLGIEQAIKVLKGYPIEYSLDSGCQLITKENMYEDENQKLLYPVLGQN